MLPEMVLDKNWPHIKLRLLKNFKDRHGRHHQRPKLRLQVQPRHHPEQLELQPIDRGRHRRRRHRDAASLRRSKSFEAVRMVLAVGKGVKDRHLDVDGHRRQT